MNNQTHHLPSASPRRCLASLVAAVLIAWAPSLVWAQNIVSFGPLLRGAAFVFHENIAPNTPVGSNDDGHAPVIDVGTRSKPAFVDIDNDGDLDVFIGHSTGRIRFYLNTGSRTNAVFVPGSSTLDPIDVGDEAAPAFADLDGDGDMDALIGSFANLPFYYRNEGNPTNAVFVLQTGANNPLTPYTNGVSLYFDSYTCPTMTDVNHDGRIDIVVGGNRGYLHYFENTGSATNPAFTARLGADNPFIDIDLNGRSTPFAVDRNGNGRPEGFILGNTGTGDLLVCSLSGTQTKYRVPVNENDYPIFDLGVDAQPGPTLVDLDGDGRFELVTGGFEGRLDLYLGVVVDFAGWQSLNFNLPGDDAIAGAGADADGDGLPNLLEYALGSPPTDADAKPHFPAPYLDLNGHLAQAIQIREDDPKLSVVAEFSNDVLFTSPTTVQPVVSDPDIDDGLKTLTFIDPVASAGAPKRFMRLKFGTTQ